ncbi:MAG: hypothetical protein ACE5J7_01005 [Candidatus Aenigmatarchaeota archaeon]
MKPYEMTAELLGKSPDELKEMDIHDIEKGIQDAREIRMSYPRYPSRKVLGSVFYNMCPIITEEDLKRHGIR